MKKLLYLCLISILLAGCQNQSSSKENEIAKTDYQFIKIFTNKNLIETVKEKMKQLEKDDEVKNKNDEEIEVINNPQPEVIKDTDTQTSKADDKPVNNTVNNNAENHSAGNPADGTTNEAEKPVQSEVVQKPIVTDPVKQEDMANQVFNQINAYRQQNGLQPYNLSANLQQQADEHAYNMASQGALWHVNNGECITNYDDPFNAWVSSPEHNAILLTENNTQAAVSIYYKDGYYYSVFRTAW